MTNSRLRNLFALLIVVASISLTMWTNFKYGYLFIPLVFALYDKDIIKIHQMITGKKTRPGLLKDDAKKSSRNK